MALPTLVLSSLPIIIIKCAISHSAVATIGLSEQYHHLH